MKICYVVYREDNVMVFDSQVLEYLKIMRDKVEHIELVVFRHEKNLFHRADPSDNTLRRRFAAPSSCGKNLRLRFRRAYRFVPQSSRLLLDGSLHFFQYSIKAIWNIEKMILV